MRVRTIAFCVLAGLLVPAAGADQQTFIHGEFTHNPALMFHGDVGPNMSHWVVRYPVPLFLGPVLDAQQVSLTVYEQRFPLGVQLFVPRVRSSDPLLNTPDAQQRTLFDLHAEVQAVLPETQWQAYGTNTSSLQLSGADCRMSLARPASDQITRPFHRADTPFKVPLVEASCKAHSVAMRDGFDWVVWNTTLLLRHRSPTDGQLRIEQLRTGVTAEENQFAPGTYDEVHRRAVFRPATGFQQSVWPASDGIRFLTPAAVAIGEFELAQGSGEVVWGESWYQGAPTDPKPAGRFTIRSEDGVFLRVQGLTTNAPSELGWLAAQDPAALAVAATLGLALLALGAFALFARLHPDDLSKHPARAALLQFLSNNPGARLTEIQAATSMPRSTALHHLRALERAGLVVHRRVGKFLIYGTAQQMDTLSDPGFLAHRVRRNEFILQILQEQPGLRQQEIADKMGVTQSYVSRILSRLERDGLVERAKSDRRSFRLRGAAPTGNG